MLETMNEIKMFNEQPLPKTKKNSPRMTQVMSNILQPGSGQLKVKDLAL